MRPHGLALGQGSSALEVLVATSDTEPTLVALRSAWKARKGGRAAPLLLVVLYGDRAALCGPAGEDAPAQVDLDPGQVERICREALEQPDRHAALRALRDSLPALESELGGIRNEGFLATHELRVGARQRPDWREAGERARRTLGKRGRDLLVGLGFQVEPFDRVTSILRAGERKVALAVLLERNESPELPAERFSSLSPVSYALAVADRENLPYVVIQHGAKVRIHPTRVGVGVGRRGRTETFVECHAGLLRDRDAAYLWLLCSAEALAPGGSLEELIEASGRFSGALAERLRDRVYQSVVPRLAEGIVAARGLRKPTAGDLADTYEMTMALLFRLLFVAYAEDKDLLPYRWNGLYRRRSLKTKAQELLDLARAGTPFDDGDSLWAEVTGLFRAVDTGKHEWGVPAYDGGLFSEDSNVSRIGALLSEIRLPNTVLGPALRDLLLVETDEGLGPVDFRSLGVGEFGTIYEGLLESELSVAERDLAVDREGVYRPCRKGEEPLVRAGEVYLHNASGARKSTGSYFTKPFAVEHLLKRALEPAVEEHLARLDALDEEAAGGRFFDFRVADIAMGSGHFLIAAIDHIERAFTGYLSRRRLPAVAGELAALRAAALDALGPLADQVEIEDTQLLRRVIARRCIYGVDLNPTAVQLARLAVWIHTFVPGLSLSLLDHNLVRGNSLVGIARLSEVKEKVEEGSLPLFPIDAEHMLGEAREHLAQLARIADATPTDLQRARRVREKALEAVASAAALCDIVTACRIVGEPLQVDVSNWETLKRTIAGSREHRAARKVLGGLEPFHFPVAFPEVFLRERAGFDVIVGNPPWQEATLEEDAFWARHAPGLRALPQREQEAEKARLRRERPDLLAAYESELAEAEVLRRALTSGGFPGMGIGDPDLYKAFCWRFWQLVAKGGCIGVVLPRSAFTTAGSGPWRLEALANTDTTIAILRNKGEWLFNDVNPGYTICLTNLGGADLVREPTIRVYGVYESLEEFESGAAAEGVPLRVSKLRQFDPLLCLPAIQSAAELRLFVSLFQHPRFGDTARPDWRARAARDLDATNARKDGILKVAGDSPVYNHLNIGHFTFDASQGEFMRADFKKACEYLQDRRLRASRNKNSAFSEMPLSWSRDPATLPTRNPRIAFRDVVHASNPRKVWAALVPANTLLTNAAPYLIFPKGRLEAQAFVLAMLNSSICDWFGHLRIGLHLNFFILDALPMPVFDPTSRLAARATELAVALATSGDGEFGAWERLGGFRRGVDRESAVAELDGIASLLYRIERREMPIIWNQDTPLRPPLKEVVRFRQRWEQST